MFDYSVFNDMLKDKQSKIKDLKTAEDGLGKYIGTRSRGCETCQNGTAVMTFTTQRCNLSCKYCPQKRPFYPLSVDIPEDDTEKLLADSNLSISIAHIKSRAMAKKNIIKGLSYTGGEPFLVIPKICEISRTYTSVLDIKPYQWIYTNSIHVTEDKLKALQDIGIDEIRFDWAATDFQDNTLKKMELARKYIPHISIEIPMWDERKILKDFIPKIQSAVDAGAQLINCIELLVTSMNAEALQATEASLYQHPDGGGISPYWSRLLTYDVMEYVQNNNISISVNDCSNDSRVLLNIMRQSNGIDITRG